MNTDAYVHRDHIQRFDGSFCVRIQISHRWVFFLCRNSHPEWTESRNVELFPVCPKFGSFFPNFWVRDYFYEFAGKLKITVTIREGGQWDGTRIHSVSVSLLYYCVCHGWVILSGRQESRLSLEWEQTTRCAEVGYRDNPTGSDS